MEAREAMCQSCGMPLQKEGDFGTKVDGTRSSEYCHFCFKDGRFTDAGISMEQKIDKIIKLAVSQMNMPEDAARAMANKLIPTLKRWQKETT